MFDFKHRDYVKQRRLDKKAYVVDAQNSGFRFECLSCGRTNATIKIKRKIVELTCDCGQKYGENILSERNQSDNNK